MENKLQNNNELYSECLTILQPTIFSASENKDETIKNFLEDIEWFDNNCFTKIDGQDEPLVKATQPTLIIIDNYDFNEAFIIEHVMNMKKLYPECFDNLRVLYVTNNLTRYYLQHGVKPNIEKTSRLLDKSDDYYKELKTGLMFVSPDCEDIISAFEGLIPFSPNFVEYFITINTIDKNKIETFD